MSATRLDLNLVHPLPECADCGLAATGHYNHRSDYFEPVETPEGGQLCGQCAVASGYYDDWDAADE